MHSPSSTATPQMPRAEPQYRSLGTLAFPLAAPLCPAPCPPATMPWFRPPAALPPASSDSPPSVGALLLHPSLWPLPSITRNSQPGAAPPEQVSAPLHGGQAELRNQHLKCSTPALPSPGPATLPRRPLPTLSQKLPVLRDRASARRCHVYRSDKGRCVRQDREAQSTRPSHRAHKMANEGGSPLFMTRKTGGQARCSRVGGWLDTQECRRGRLVVPEGQSK